MQVAERAQPLADGAHSLASRACSSGKTYPLKSMENPDVVHKVCDGPWLHQTERTVHATAPRLCSVPKSHPALLIIFNSFSSLLSG
ncbi:unnamed protein product [Brassica rapa]|uniref:Uncharacterized protein n=1 Tax=Brassica campestris TaxID=3711 RepID=A0A8D9DIX9_BRACM|nr:unnamed protein product [Brassica rapa]